MTNSPPDVAAGAELPPLLCITVPTIPGRESLLSRCLWSITEQLVPDVEVLVVAGTGQLGDKANLAAAHTTARYMTVVDDDDYLDGAYLSLVVPLLEGYPDYVGLKILQWIDNRFHGVGVTRGDRPGFSKRGNTHGPVPKGVTRTELWRQVPMGNRYFGDRDWSAKVAPLIVSHRFVDRAIYVYDHQPATSAFVGGGHRDVGAWPFDPDRVGWLTVN